MKTLKNKLYAIALLVCGSLGVALENDATALVLFGMDCRTIVLCQRELDLLKDRAANNGSFFLPSQQLQVLL